MVEEDFEGTAMSTERWDTRNVDVNSNSSVSISWTHWKRSDGVAAHCGHVRGTQRACGCEGGRGTMAIRITSRDILAMVRRSRHKSRVSCTNSQRPLIQRCEPYSAWLVKVHRRLDCFTVSIRKESTSPTTRSEATGSVNRTT